MTTVTVPAWATGQSYQLWGYTPSHRILLARSPGSGPDGDNLDIRFTGVRAVQLDTKFDVERVDRIPESSRGSLVLFRYLLVGSRGFGHVVAEDMAFERNSRALFEGLPDAASGTFEDAKRLELVVRAELVNRFPEATISDGALDAPDFVVSLRDRHALIEVIRANEDPVKRQVRRLVMERIPRWNSPNLPSGPLIVVVGGVRPERLVAELPAHLRSALGHTEVQAIVWDASGPGTLSQTLEPVLRPVSPSASTSFMVFQDSSGAYRWRLLAANGQMLATGDSYATAESARNAVAAVRQAALAGRVLD